MSPGLRVEPTDRVRARYEREILRLVAEHPVESGSFHPAEEPLREWIAERGEDEVLGLWERQAARRPGLAADLLRCLGVLDAALTAGWGHALMGRALASRSLDIRSAAVEALEHWADARARAILARSDERVPWLRDYVERVLDEITAE